MNFNDLAEKELSIINIVRIPMERVDYLKYRVTLAFNYPHKKGGQCTKGTFFYMTARHSAVDLDLASTEARPFVEDWTVTGIEHPPTVGEIAHTLVSLLNENKLNDKDKDRVRKFFGRRLVVFTNRLNTRLKKVGNFYYVIGKTDQGVQCLRMRK